MSQQIINYRIGDNLTPISFTLKQMNEAGTALAAVDLTGLTVNIEITDQDGVTVVAETTTGVTSSNDATGEVDYTPQGDITTAGRYYPVFKVYNGASVDTFPVEPRDFVICARA